MGSEAWVCSQEGVSRRHAEAPVANGEVPCGPCPALSLPLVLGPEACWEALAVHLSTCPCRSPGAVGAGRSPSPSS